MTNFRKYLLFSLIFALLNAVLLLVFFVPRLDHADTQEYTATIRYITGDPEGQIFLHRILKPLPLLIGAFLFPVLNPEEALVFQNLIFYFLSICLVFSIVYGLYQNEKQAFYGTVLFSAAYPMLAYGLAPITDIPGWSFYLFLIWLSLKFIKKPNCKLALLAGLAGGIGMLFKENLAAGTIFFISLILIAGSGQIKEKIKYIFIFFIAFLLPTTLSALIIYRLYSHSLLDWFFWVWNSNEGDFYVYSPLRTIVEIGRAFTLGWLFVFWGVLKEFNQRNAERTKILIALILPSLSFFFWPFLHNRIIYIAAPLLVLLGSFGVLTNFKNQKINIFGESILLLLYIAINYFLLDFLLKYGFLFKDIF